MKIMKSMYPSNKFLVLGDQALHSGMNFLLTLSLVRILDTTSFGWYTSMVLFTLFVVSVSNAVLIQPLQVFMAKVKDHQSYFSFVFIIQLVLLSVVVLALQGLFYFDFSLLEHIKELGNVFCLFVCAYLLHDFFRKYCLARGLLVHAFLMDLTTLMINVLALIFFYVTEANLQVVVLCIGLSYLPSILGSSWVHRPNLSKWTSWRSYFKVHQREGKWFVMTSVLQWWASNLFVVASGAFLGATAIGALRLVQMVFGVLNVLLQTLENYALPYAARLMQDSMDDSRKYLRKLSGQIVLLAGFLLVLVFLFPKFILSLMAGPEYESYAFLVRGMAVLYFVIFMGYPIRMAIRMLDLNQFFFMGYVLTFVFSLLSFKYLLAGWNLWGAVSGLIINQLLLLSFWYYILINKKFNLWK
jgi:O-antigen/teichoic acid export membrane protein